MKRVSNLRFEVQGWRTRAFTLIELLMVIMVILILAALLLPVLSMARAKALRAHCVSNIRQVDLLLLTYGHDNNDRLPSTPYITVLPPPLVDMVLRGGIPNRVFFDPAKVEVVKGSFLGGDISESWFGPSFHGTGRQIGYSLTLPGYRYLLPININFTIVPQPVYSGQKIVLASPIASERVLVASATCSMTDPGIEDPNGHVDSKGLSLGDNVAMLDGSARWRKYQDMFPRLGETNVFTWGPRW